MQEREGEKQSLGRRGELLTLLMFMLPFQPIEAWSGIYSGGRRALSLCWFGSEWRSNPAPVLEEMWI